MTDIEESLPEGCHNYENPEEVPENIQKYWHQRYDIFSRYDQGVWLTDNAWFGVTPEPVANAVAAHVADSAPAEKTVLVDTFAGVGGNTIAFARSGRWERIFAIEKDPAALKCAKHNAKIYGVEKKIWWIEGDCFKTLKTRLASMGKTAIIFGSPPWGGPGYLSEDIFDLSKMQPYSLKTLMDAFTKMSPDVVLYLPRTSDLNQLAALTKNDKEISVTHYCMRGASKALCAYVGNFQFG